MTAPTVSSPPLPRIQTPHGVVSVATLAQIENESAWRNAFLHERKDARFFRIVEETLDQGFDHKYFLIEGPGNERAVQPFFIHDQDLLGGSGPRMQAMAAGVRKILPRALKLRTMMVGCAAGEGRLDSNDEARSAWISRCLAASLGPHARRLRCGMIVLKEFHVDHRLAMKCLTEAGFTRVPSLPMTRLGIDYADFDDYMAKALSKVTRKNLRRKFRDAEEAEPISLEVLHDISPFVDEVYPLYLAVYDRSPLHFEKLTKDFLRRLGREMPDKARFFVWRQKGKAVAFSACMLNGDALYDEYVGLDYSVALDLHLYFYTLRDIVRWAMGNGYKWYCSSALSYDPKLHLKSKLVPLDLYVAHTSAAFNHMLARVLPLLEPTRKDTTLKQFANYAELWGER